MFPVQRGRSSQSESLRCETVNQQHCSRHINSPVTHASSVYKHSGVEEAFRLLANQMKSLHDQPRRAKFNALLPIARVLTDRIEPLTSERADEFSTDFPRT